jgi:Chaperone of endosialidase
MGKPQSTGNLVNALAQDSSNNIGIGGAANASFKLRVTGSSAGDSVYAIGDGASSGGALKIKQYASSAANEDGYSTISTLNTGVFYFTSASTSPNFKNFVLNPSGLTDNTLRTFTLPDASGTIALTSNLSAYLPLTGGTLTGALSGTSATFNHNDAPTIRVQRNGGTDSNTVLEFTNASRSFFIGSNGTVMGLGGTSGAVSSQPLQIDSAGAATFSSSIAATSATFSGLVDINSNSGIKIRNGASDGFQFLQLNTNTWAIRGILGNDNITFTNGTGAILVGGAATFLSSITSLAASGTGVIIAESTATNGEGLVSVRGKNSSGTSRRADFKYDNADVVRIATASPINMQFETNDIPRLTITSGGNVGIGTSSPNSLASTTNLVVRGVSGSSTALVQSLSADAGCSVSLYSGASSSDDPAILFQKNLRFGSVTDAGLGSFAERMRITSGGTIYSSFGTSGTSARTDLTPNLILEGKSGVASGRAGMSLLANGTGNSLIMFGASGSSNTDGFISYVNATRALDFGTADNFRMRITSGGDIGINTTAITNPNSLNKVIVIAAAAPVGVVLFDSRDANPIGLENRGAVFNLTYGTTSILVADGTNGNIGIGVANSSVTRLLVRGLNTSSSNFAFVATDSAASNLLVVRNDGAIFFKDNYPFTTASGANLWIDSSGVIQRNVSSIKYKTDVQDYNKGLADLMKLRAVSYLSKSEIDNPKRYAGMIAEELYELGFSEYVNLDKNGDPDSISYASMVALLIKSIQELNQKVNALENK